MVDFLLKIVGYIFWFYITVGVIVITLSLIWEIISPLFGGKTDSRLPREIRRGLRGW
jgi:hypothetical protein